MSEHPLQHNGAIERMFGYITYPKDTDCWIWSGPTTKEGYGVLWAGRKQYKAHRIVYEYFAGEVIRPGLLACHKCDRSTCVNPAHIFIGTNSDNTKDAWNKGRLWINTHQPAATARLRDHCKRGHPWPESLVLRSDGSARCRECRKLEDRRRDSTMKRKMRRRKENQGV